MSDMDPSGSLDELGRPWVALLFGRSQDTVPSRVDTGFNQTIVMSREFAIVAGFEATETDVPVILGDLSTAYFRIHLGHVKLQGQWIPAPALVPLPEAARVLPCTTCNSSDVQFRCANCGADRAATMKREGVKDEKSRRGTHVLIGTRFMEGSRLNIEFPNALPGGVVRIEFGTVLGAQHFSWAREADALIRRKSN
ncbi:MAG: hypothetical protein RLZZ26_90 [Candidatus Parcubacteria bacterium]|jgi:predicted aspartyl protease